MTLASTQDPLATCGLIDPGIALWLPNGICGALCSMLITGAVAM